MRKIFAAVAVCFALGCSSPELQQLVRDQAATSDADLKDYRAGKLTPAQIDRHFFDDAASWAAANYDVNGTPVPPDYAPISTASAVK